MHQLRPTSLSISHFAWILFPCISRRNKPQISKPFNLLPELIIVVLLHLQQDLQEDLQCLVHAGSREPGFEEHMRATIANARYTLYSAALVSKAWYQACTPILYAHPILVTPRQLELFRNLVAETPALGSSVKVLSIMIVKGRPRREDQDDALVLRERQVHEDVSLLLQSLSALSSLTLQIPVNYTEKCTWDVPQEQTTLSSLQSLNLVRSLLVGATDLQASHSFVNLQILCLNSVVVGRLFQFPALPSLHTLQILKSSVESFSPDTSHFVPTNFPASTLR